MEHEWCTAAGVDGVTCSVWSLMGQVQAMALNVANMSPTVSKEIADDRII